MDASGENTGRKLLKEILAHEPIIVAQWLLAAQLGNRYRFLL
jgi:hypothetical protein